MTDSATVVNDVTASGPKNSGFADRIFAFPRVFGVVATRWRQGDIPWLSDLPISRRFGLLVALAVISALSFAVAYTMAERRIDAMLVSQDGLRRLNDLAGDVRAKASTLQNHEEQFLRERNPEAAEAFRQDSAFVTKSLAAMAELTQSSEVAGHVGELQAGFAQAGTRFENVARLTTTLGLTDRNGLRGRLASSVKAVEDELKMWPNAGPLIPPELQMRQAEKNFMIYGTESYLNQHRKYANQFDLALDSSGLPASTQEDFRKMLAAYTKDMQAFAEGTIALDAEVDALRKQFQALQPKLTQVFSYAREGMAHAIRQQEEVRTSTSRLVAGFGILAVLSFFAAALILARSITHPVRLIESAMERLANGDHGVIVPGIARKDEIGDMAKAVEVFKDNAIAMVRLQQEQEAVRAEAEATSRQRMLALADHFENAVKSVADQVNQNSQAIKLTAESMARQEASSGDNQSLSVAEAAEQSRRTVADVADAAAELAASVEGISRLVVGTSSVVREAVAELDRTNARVTGLSEVAGKIDRVVNLISDIANRTNMLSLNATIEAQRAGEAGKGFAVVAGEVKHLAQQTGDSTREIAEQVAAIQTATAETVAAIGGVGSAIRRVDDIAGQVAEAVARQSAVTARIGRCVDKVTADTRSVTDGVVAVTQSAACYCGSAVRVIWAADDLAVPASSLKQEVDGFLTTIRA